MKKMTSFLIFMSVFIYVSADGSDINAEKVNLDANEILKIGATKAKDQLSSNSNTNGFHCKIKIFFRTEENILEESLDIQIAYKSPDNVHMEYIYELVDGIFLMMGIYNTKALIYSPTELLYYLVNDDQSPSFIARATKDGININPTDIIDFSTGKMGIIDIDISSILDFFVDSKEISIIKKNIKNKEVYIITAKQKGPTKWVTGIIKVFADDYLPYQIWIYVGEGEDKQLCLIFKEIIYNYYNWPDKWFQVPLNNIKKLWTVVEVDNLDEKKINNIDNTYFGKCINSFIKINAFDYEDDGNGRVKPVPPTDQD